MMQRVQFCWPNRADTASFSGGAWSVASPLAHLASRYRNFVARSQDTALTSTWFDVDLGRPRYIRHVAVIGHNLTSAGMFRVRLALADLDAPDVDSGWRSPWRAFHAFGDVPWGEDGWYGGLPTAEERAGYPSLAIVSLPASLNVRYVRVEFADTGNTAGYIEAARLWVTDAWQPAYNYSYGSTLGWEDPSLIETAKSGTEYFDQGRMYRVWRGQLGRLVNTEGYARYLEMLRQLGTTHEFLLIPDADDTEQTMRRTFVARLRVLSPLENVAYNLKSGAVEAKEMI